MTDVATAPRRADEQAGTPQVGHWIGGAHVAGRSGRGGPFWTPATGERRAEDWSATPMPPAYRSHVAARIADFLAPETVTRVRAEWLV